MKEVIVTWLNKASMIDRQYHWNLEAGRVSMVIPKCMEDVFMEMGSTVCGVVGVKLNDSKHEKTKEGSPH